MAAPMGANARLTSGVATSAAPAADERASIGDEVVIELSRQQVNQVLRAASGSENLTVSMSTLIRLREALENTAAPRADSRMSRSLLAGLVALASFPADGGYLGILEVARILDMSPSSAHRYLSTLTAVGLLERNPDTRRYRLAW
jgi:DNA-binding transcriptional ArsR family regulator